MTEEEFMYRVQTLMDVVHRDAISSAWSVLQSGAIDLEDTTGDYYLPKAFICAFLASERDQFMLNRKDFKAEVKNLSHFV